MKKIYIIPTINIEDFELGGLMEAGASQWNISGDDAAPDNKDITPGGGITGGDNGEVPKGADSKKGGFYQWKSEWSFDDDL